VTVPVGVPAPVTVAVKLTGCPKLLGFCDDVTVVVVELSACADETESSTITNAQTSVALLASARPIVPTDAPALFPTQLLR